MEEVSTKYNVLLNVYLKGNIEKTKKLIKDAMISSGFKKVTIPPMMPVENGLYNNAMQFKIALINK